MAAAAAELHVLGIRHHGPGSARTVERALEELRPDAVLVEGAPELDALLPFAGRADLVPPVAALVYDVVEPRRAVFSPLAAFSPEWVALRWALAHGVPVSFADLPAAILLAPGGAQEDVVHHDPIAELAAAAGAADPERWWEDAVEQRGASAVAAFAAIADGIRAVRETHEDDLQLRRREASMRLGVRRAVRSGAARIAFVCGAYHAPALDRSAFPPKREDDALLAGLPRTRVAATWAPWTSERLAASSGYGAGVAAPGWYAHLFETTGDPVTSWMVRASRALRAADLPASPASAVDASRLATTLATLRGRPAAGLDEVTDAVLAVLCEGSAVPLRLIERELVVGSLLGSVPEDVPQVPLASDLAREQRRLRMKPAAERTALRLDLRRENPLARSVLLHRLALLDVPWGRVVETSGEGTFAEAWELQWRPELSVALVVAGLHGTTIADAAAAALAERAAATEEVARLGALVETALLADLPAGLDAVVRRLGDRTAQHTDELGLLTAVEPLARVRRYGSVRGVDTADVARLLTEIVTRAAIGLRAACSSLDDEAAATMRTAVEAAERGVRLLELPDDEWTTGLAAVADDDRAHGSVAGRAMRMLLDRGLRDADAAALAMSLRLSAAADASDGASWLDGFLAGDAQVLLHDDGLRGLVDAWVARVPEAVFEEVLPLVRRTFAGFAPPERRLLGERLRHGDRTAAPQEARLDRDRGLPAVRRMAALIGLAAPA